jgi:hypothetical protein
MASQLDANCPNPNYVDFMNMETNIVCIVMSMILGSLVYTAEKNNDIGEYTISTKIIIIVLIFISFIIMLNMLSYCTRWFYKLATGVVVFVIIFIAALIGYSGAALINKFIK